MIVTAVVAVVLTVLLFIMIMVIMVLLLRFYGKQCYSARAKQKEYAKTLIMIIIIRCCVFLQYREATAVPATEGDRATKEEVHEVADSGYVNDPKGYVNVEHPDFTPLSTTGDERSSSIYVEVHSRY